MVIAANPFTKTMLAGIEGGILRTEDHFDSWKHLELGTDAFDPENPINLRYPYISAIVFSERYEGFVLAGGLDRGREYMQSYLGFSMDDGRTWEDKSALIKDYGQRVNMERDPAGRILIGLMPRPDSLPGTLLWDGGIQRRSACSTHAIIRWFGCMIGNNGWCILKKRRKEWKSYGMLKLVGSKCSQVAFPIFTISPIRIFVRYPLIQMVV